MRILLLLTLIGLAVGLGVEHDCDGRVNGVYATSPCSNEFNHCYNGQVTIKTCPRGLVFNPDSNQCDFDSNVSGCAARAEVTCNNRKDGTYTIGCSSSFFFCSNGIIHMSTCQNGLFYDVDRKTCDHKFRVRACGGHPEVEREPVTRPPLLVPTYAPTALKSFAKIRGHITDFSHSCKGKPDGTYPLDACSDQYIHCTDEVSQLGKCAVGEVFVDSGKCTPVAKVPECSKALSGGSTIDCSSRQDGYYSSSCSSTFVSCSSGVARQMKCPSPLVFNEVKGYCDAPEDCKSDTGVAPPADSPKSKRDYQPNADATKSVSPSFCAMRKDGLYAEECSVDFISCEQGVATPMKCPSGLLFNNKKGHCDYPEDCLSGSTALDQKLPPAASDQHLSSVATTIECKGKKDGYYSNGCVPDYVSCISGVASLMTCPASLVFNEAKGYCDYPENCSGGSASVPPSPVLAAAVAQSPPTATSVDCKGKMDGFYSNGCVPDYVSCVDGVASPMTCPASLVFNEKQGYCDYPESCTAGPAPAHSSPVPAMPAQSPSAAAMPAQSPSAPPYAPPTSTSSVSCKGKKDGYYSDGCVSDFVHCTDGVAIPMTCPASLVFNEKKGYCDYPESCSTGPAPAVPLPAPAVPAHSPPAPSLLASPAQSLPVDCKGKKDGYYSNGCVPDFVSCNDGVASPMTCPTSLVFNEKKGYCDYPESCSEGPAPAVPLPALTSPVHSPPAPTQASLIQSLAVDCMGKKDGYYSSGCVPDFVSCNDGVASPMTCPSSLVFNEKKGYCDYPENCSTGPAPAVPLPVPAMAAQSPAQAYAPPAPTSTISCKGRKDGYHSDGCVPDFVFCIAGVASPMTCPASLVFNEKKGYCDYPESCNTGSAPALPPPFPAMPVQSPSAPAYAPPTSTSSVSCKGRKDGYYSNGCVSDFVHCTDGVAIPMKCPASLVFNEKKGYCDYPESCSTESVPAAPLPAPAAPLPAPAAPVYAPPASLQASPVQSLPVDCKGRKDGYYSNGCVPEFVSCRDGVASPMTCPASLVFNEKKGYCDYPESCSTGPAAAPPLPVPIVPVQPPSLDHAAPTSLSTLSCNGKKDGYYSNGCVADFVYCVDGVASPMKCPASLVFNEKKGYCDYPESCSTEPAPAIPLPAPVHSPPASMQASSPQSLPVDCKGKKDGYYSNGCTSDFVSCFDGVASPMKCPASLVFNEKKGYCDYPESCSTGPAAAPPLSAPVVPAQPPSPPPPPSPMTPISCKGKKDGYYSNGCVSDFVFCVDGVASPMKCPSSLVFNEKKGYCDYPESCSSGPAPAVPLPVPVVPSQPTASAQAPPTPSTPVDCKGKKDGYYSNGCVADFVYCVDGVASPMKCPASLVFNEKKGYCDYPESCSTVPTPAIPMPAPTAPVYAPPASQQASPVQALPVDCKGKKDGYYSNGCVSDFVYCVDGVASPMKCPASLIFNEKKGYCDYPESCSTGPAAAPPLPAPVVPPTQPPASAHAPPSSLTPVSCKGKKDGYYSSGCVSDFVYCVGEVASLMTCPASLVFNEKKGYCDYPESCSAVPAPAVPSPVPSVPAQPSGPAYAPDSPSSPISCKGRKDGYYSNGCVSEFVYCVDKVATPMTCPASLVFNEKKGYCDYPESCSSAPAPALPLPAPVVPPTQPPASAHAPPNSLTPVSCKGKKDGYYSNGCVSDFVYCVDGVASPMTCPASLVFNEKKGYCDYPESCAAGPAPVNPWPTPVVPPTQPPASAHAPPSPLTPVSCKGKKDGYYSNGCVSDFVYCVDGVASPMSCPASLVFNEKKGYCDYPESCSTGPAAAPPLPAPLVTAQPPYAPPQTPPSPLTPISCKGKKDGYYSNGCVSDFVFCVDGVASAMKCPASLVFNEKKGYCDYPESCSTGPAPALPMPVPVVPSQPSASAQAPPAPLTFVDCKGKKDGYYSSGCVSEFVYCVDGVPTLMKCPSSLVFNAKNGYCDYPEACSSPPAQAAPAVPPSTSTSGPSSQMNLDCTGRGDGYFAIGCSPDFVYCSDGIATFMKCPASLVFNAEKNYCDYPENCSGTGLDQADSQTSTTAPSPSVHSFVCPKPNGAFSNGCSAEYYVCSNAVAHVMLCPGNLVFNAAEGYCDLKDSCLQGEKAKDATTPVAYSPVTSTVPTLPPSGTATTPSASSKCSNLPDGRYGSPCGTKFMICSSGIAYFMNCPADLVFDSKQSRCVYADECGREPVLKSPSDVAPSSYTPLSSRDDCVGKTDGLHSLGCIAEFIQCVDGSAYTLYCPAGLVFVEELGVCDVPSACSATPKHEPADGPMSYEPVVDDKSKDSPGCDIDGYFSQPCASEYFNCVGGVKFVGKCPAGLVFNMDKVYCDYPDNCRKGEDSASSEARPVPSTVVNKDDSCKGRPDGVITDTDCQHQFTTCSNEIAYVTKCPAGLVYSVKAKLCDYPEACGTASNDSVSSSTGSYPVQKTTVPSESVPHPTSASVQYQHSVVGKDLCAGKSDGPLNSTNCRPSFSFCVSGALYSTSCPEGLLFSFASRRCEWRSECEDVVASPSEPSTTTTSLPVHSAEFDCSTRPNGRYSLGGCVGRFVMCSDGRAYVRSCPSNLVYNEAKGLCDYDCSGPSAQPTAAPVETECVTSVALGRCSSKFWRCRNGKLESAQCPGQSLFDETYSLCVYNLPECKTELGTTTSTSVEVPTTTATPVQPTVYPTHGHYYPPPPPPPPPAPQYPAQYPPYPPYGASMGSSFGLFYPAAFPMGFRDVMYSREKVNNGPIDFQSRSAVVGGGFNPPVRDIFDGIVSPWLLPGIDRVFLPNVFKPPKQPDPYDDPFKPKGIDISGLLQQNEVNTPEPLGMFGMPLEDAVPPDDEEHHQDHGITHEEELESSSVANVTSPASEDKIDEASMKAMDAVPADDIEGSGDVEMTRKSGDVEVTRKRRSYSNNPDFSTACTGPQSSGLVSIGFCRQDFIFCKSLGSGMMAACPVGDLFDSSTNKCVTSETCGIPVEVAEPPARKPIPPPVPVPLPILPQRRPPTPPSVPVTVPPVPSVPVFPPPHAVPTTTTTKRPPMIFPPMPAPVAAAQHLSPPSQDGCTEDYAVDCNGNFMKCSNGIAYPMKCPAGLVYDQTKQYCDYPEAVAGCGGAQVDHTPPGHSPVYPTDKTYPGDPILPPTTQAPTTKAPDFCSFMSDGLYSQGCTASFVICLDRRIQTSMNCPVGTWFDQTRGACDSREKVAACGGTSSEPSLHQPQPVVVRTTTPSSYDDSCSPDPQAVGPCMPKFVVCSHGIHTEMECAQPLVFNPATVSCDYREFVKECLQSQGQDAVPSSNGESAATIAPALLAAPTTTTTAPTTTTTPSTTTTTPPIKCVYSEERPAFALDYCARVYGMCTVSGVLKREECDVGFLFDSHLSTCVPAEQCGQERLKDLLSKVTFAPPVAAAQVAQDSSKPTSRKDERCHNSPEGAMKPMGRCRSSYIRCMGGEAIVEPCATTAEVFSSAVGACVLRINAPECHSSPPRSAQPYSSASSNDPSMFCRTRTDGLYRNPTDCTGILQCFGGDVFEYPSCSSGLVFNELTSKCDYRDAVPECRQAEDDKNVEHGCRGASHGDLVPDESDCQQFYRCVWNRLESMRCPSGTVFNPKLSVCDWPDNVPQCSAQQDESAVKVY